MKINAGSHPRELVLRIRSLPWPDALDMLDEIQANPPPGLRIHRAKLIGRRMDAGRGGTRVELVAYLEWPSCAPGDFSHFETILSRWLEIQASMTASSSVAGS